MRTNKYDIFLKSLNKAVDDGCIRLLFRGQSREDAFKKLKLDIRYNTIDQFAKKLFFFGEKARYFWNEKISTPANRTDFNINETSDKVFEYIFKKFNTLADETTTYFDKGKNREALAFFKDVTKMEFFIDAVKNESEEMKMALRNHYFIILHRLAEPEYKEQSNFISGSTDEIVVDNFDDSEIKINFWEPNFKRPILEFKDDIPTFVGKPYEEENEESIFSVIFPQFIYSFEFENRICPNPAIEKMTNFDFTWLTGIDIKQDNFVEQLHKETNYRSGVQGEGSTVEEIS